MPKICGYCCGTGKEDVWKDISCYKCYGTGQEFRKVFAEFEMPFDCSSCGGSGKISAITKQTCSRCRGSGYTNEPGELFDFRR